MGENLIYALVDPRNDEVRYVGQTTYGETRFGQHGMEAFLKQSERTYKTRWIRKLHRLGLNYKAAVLEEVPDPADLDLVESFWISQMLGMGCRLTNATKGGGGLRGHKHTEEHKRKISEAQLGEKGHWFGKKFSLESRIKKSRSLGGRAIRDSLGREFPSIAEAARQLGLHEDNIRRAVKRGGTVGGGQGSHGRGTGRRGGGITFEYIDDTPPTPAK